MTAPPVERVLAALREHDFEPKRSGTGWACRCPAHDDHDPSLSINAGDDGRALVKCFAGCSTADVVKAIGLTMADLMPDDPTRRNGHAPKTRRRGDATGGRTFPTAREAVAALESRLGQRSATWTYMNAAGEPVGLVVRWDREDGKDVRPVSRTEDGSGWVIGGMLAPHPLYRLPELLATPAGSRVYVTEGEKAADAARAVGLTATSSPHGSKSAGKADWSPLAGRDVVVLPDHDEAGERYANDVARLATAAGAKSVRIVRLVDGWPDLPEGGDIADLVERCDGDADAINELREKIEALVDEAEAVEAQAPAVPRWMPFPVDVLPEPVRGFVTSTARAIGCDDSYVALPLLACLASAIGNTHQIALKCGWTEPAIVWAAIVGESGTMKTPAFRAVLKPLRAMQDEAFAEHSKAMAEHEAECLRYDAELTAWKRQAAKGNAGEPPDKPAEPIARRLIVSDTTVEALAPILLDNPHGVLLARDELNGWIGSFDRYAKAGRGGADVAHWESMHGGESMTIDRKTGTPRTIHVPSASVSITGGIQPGTLARAMGPEHHESGLLARLLFAMPPRRAKRWTEADVDKGTETALERVFEWLYALTPDTDPDGNACPRRMRLGDDGKRAWITFYNEHGDELENLTGDEAAAWSKLEGYAARLALVVHLVRVAAGELSYGPKDVNPGVVDARSVGAGVTLSRWFGNEALRVYTVLGESDDDRETRRLVELIQRKGGDVSGRELVQASRAFGTVAEAEAALSRLVEAGKGSWVTPEQHGRGGPKARRFVLAPVYTVNVYRNTLGATENGNTVDVDTVDTLGANDSRDTDDAPGPAGDDAPADGEVQAGDGEWGCV